MGKSGAKANMPKSAGMDDGMNQGEGVKFEEGKGKEGKKLQGGEGKGKKGKIGGGGGKEANGGKNIG